MTGAATTAAAAPDPRGGVPALEVRGLVKEFPGTRALDGVDLTVRYGEIHALLGENGAGKSTLIKAVTGAHRATAGSIRIDGREVSFASPQEAQAAGIAVVHQHSNLVDNLSVAENLWLGRELPLRGPFVDWGAVRREARSILGRVGVSIEPDRLIAELRPDERAMVAIAKAIATDARLIILDEPTAALLPHEVDALFAQMRRLAGAGHAFLYVSHRLTEVFRIADRITVLRDGRNAGDFDRGSMDRRAVIQAIIGPGKSYDENRSAMGAGAPPVLIVEGLAGGPVQGVSFTLHEGEILGLPGLPGSGAEETLDLLFGRVPRSAGRITLAGRELALRSPGEAIAAGIALVPKDRLAEAVLHGFSVRENISIVSLDRHRIDRVFQFLSRRSEVREAERMARELNVRMPSIEAAISALSGGNQQKAILARWLSTGARLFLLSSPTAAVDVGAKGEIYALVRRLAEAGASVIFTSTEVEEFPRLCTRVLVFAEGRIQGELAGAAVTEEAIMHLAAGGEHGH
jgi:ABC-type sugar transport system ATPase subunit